LDYLIEFLPFGSKEKLPSYKMHNKILAYLDTLDKEALGKYSFILARIANFLQLGNYYIIFMVFVKLSFLMISILKNSFDN